MTKIENKKGTVKVQGQLVETTFHDLLVIALDNVGDKGVDVFEARSRSKLAKRVEPKYVSSCEVRSDIDGVLEIEDGDLERIQRLIKNCTYNCTGDFIGDFAEAFQLITE